MHHKENDEVLDNFELEVKNIEKEADEILKNALAKKLSLVSDANSEASSHILKKQDELEKRKDERIRKNKEKINEEKNEIIKNGEKEVDTFFKSSKKNLPKATEIALNKLEEYIGEL
jgi:vacuolar-type H+-ATPase subunit H